MKSLVPYQQPESGITSDDHLIELWLLDKQSALTRQKYRADIDRFLTWLDGTSLIAVTLPTLRAYEQTLEGIGQARRMRILACIKSLLTFGERLGYLPWNVGGALPLKKAPDQRARRYLSEEEVMRMYTLEPEQRNRAIIRLLYNAGLRVSELVALCWRDVIDRSDIGTGQIIVWGKGAKERAIVLKAETYQEIIALRGNAPPDAPVFTSQQPDSHGAGLDQSQVFRIVEHAAVRAGLHTYQNDIGVTHSRVSPHWLRHSHASHYMKRKGNVEVLRQTLGHESLVTTTIYAHALPDDSSSLALAL